MAGWDEILLELQKYPGPHDHIRRKYLKSLHAHSKRNVIIYYSAFLTKHVANMEINDYDMNGFMNAVKGLDGRLGLDLIIHTPGGSPNAAEAIVKYLREKFNNDIRVIVPQMAMSAGTMIACAAKEIVMGKHSSLGPIDPQFGNVSAYEIQKMFEAAKSDILANSKAVIYWQLQLKDYPAAFMYEVLNAIQLASSLAREWLGTCMFDAEQDKDIIDQIVKALNEHTSSKAHARHFNHEMCKKIGLKISALEDDQMLQDLVLSVHHAVMHTLGGSTAIKIIENHEGKAFITQENKTAN